MVVVMMMANAFARLARADLGVDVGRMRNRMATCMTLARATCFGRVYGPREFPRLTPTISIECIENHAWGTLGS